MYTAFGMLQDHCRDKGGSYPLPYSWSTVHVSTSWRSSILRGLFADIPDEPPAAAPFDLSVIGPWGVEISPLPTLVIVDARSPPIFVHGIQLNENHFTFVKLMVFYISSTKTI
ncbi:hypothetical protein V6N13_114822 [Hibiscus sabdariffa]|uniref:Uncharacterized protein n=1 Tax=Hibiscus sabdariffa TaxID=183260 RepID=A0ABR2U2X8_9ROSI